MAAITVPDFVSGLPAADVDASLREALSACDRARECAVLWFAEVQRRALYRGFGHASLELYATQGLGFSLNRYWQFKRLADDLDRLPVLREAVVRGELGWTKAQQVARVATAETQGAWVARATATGRRELEREVRAARLARAAPDAGAADLPLAPAHVAATISLRADGVRLARFEALLERARKLRLVPAGVDRLDLVLAGLEALVEGVARPGGAGDGVSAGAAPLVQIVVQQCPDCAVASVVTGRGEKRLAPAHVAALACDARVRAAGQPNRATIPPAVRAAVLARDRHRCATAGCRSARFLEVHHVVPRAQGGSNRPENLVTLCHRCHAFAHEQAAVVAPAQAASTGVP